MSRRDEIEKRTESLLDSILPKMGCELWDVEYVKEGKDYYLRAYIDKEGGVNINDCVDVSHALSDAIDADDYMGEDAYTLEVSSPGLGRKLVKDKEFTRSIGRNIDVKFYKPYEGSKEMSGRLIDFDKDKIVIEISEEKKELLRSEIALVKLSLDIDI